MAQLTALGAETGTNRNRIHRQLIAQFENLAALGPAAVPAIREFLRQNLDADFLTDGPPPGRGPKWKQDAALPASLRSGLIDTLTRIGGAEAEQLLVETLSSTARGYEVLKLARALEELAPGKYRESVLAADTGRCNRGDGRPVIDTVRRAAFLSTFALLTCLVNGAGAPAANETDNRGLSKRSGWR
ncbi:MAG: hypothetical protein AB9869_12345 [Verrucomicrobiia bacterium]